MAAGPREHWAVLDQIPAYRRDLAKIVFDRCNFAVPPSRRLPCVQLMPGGATSCTVHVDGHMHTCNYPCKY